MRMRVILTIFHRIEKNWMRMRVILTIFHRIEKNWMILTIFRFYEKIEMLFH